MTYNFGNIRRLLIKGFSDEELRAFCVVEPNFRKVNSQLNNSTGKDVIVRLLLEHAQREMLMEELLTWAEELNPAQYGRHRPYSSEELGTKERYAQEHEERKKLRNFFIPENKNSNLTIYLSRHSTPALFPVINISESKASRNPVLKKIREYQQSEETERCAQSQQNSHDGFAVVSAIEMTETIRLKNIIERPNSLDWFSRDMNKQLSKLSIKVDLEVCPEPDEYEILRKQKGTIIFIGGPRANLGSYYYLYGEEAGEIRPKRFPKNFVEFIHDARVPFECDPKECNLGVIQKYHNGNKTIIYLAGTGINGTAAAVAYVRIHLSDDEFCKAFIEKDEFSRVIEVDKRKGEDLRKYLLNDWTDDDWRILY